MINENKISFHEWFHKIAPLLPKTMSLQEVLELYERIQPKNPDCYCGQAGGPEKGCRYCVYPDETILL